MEIVAKFGAAIRGFWWALEDEERKLVIVGAVYVLWIVASLYRASAVEAEKERERDIIASKVVERLRG